MMQLVLAAELARMGAIKSGPDCLSLNGVLYSRGTSFSQRVQAAAEKICNEYLKQGIKCFLVKDGPVLTVWLSHPTKQTSNGTQTPPVSNNLVTPDSNSQMVSGASFEQTTVAPPVFSTSNTQSQSALKEAQNTTSYHQTSIESAEEKQSKRQTMTYRGHTYEVSTNEEASLSAVPPQNKPENVKKRMYRGRPY